MAELHIAKGQGLSQAIATKLGLSKDDLKNINTQQWQSVMTVIKEEQTKRTATPENDNIFTGGSDVSTIDKKSNWKSNFITQEGTVNIDDSSWNKILGFLGKSQPEESKVEPQKKDDEATKPDETPKQNVAKPQAEPAQSQAIPDNAKIQRRDIRNVGEEGSKETVARVKDEDGNKVYYQVETDPETHEEKLGQRLIADPRGLKKNQYYAVDSSIPDGAKADLKTVDGQKDSVIISYKDDNKVKHHYTTIQNEDGTIGKGEELYPIAGSNKYLSQTKINEHIKLQFNADRLPEGITVQLIQSHGDVQYIYKKDGKSIDVKDVAAMIKSEQAQSEQSEQVKSEDKAQQAPRQQMSDEDVQRFAQADSRVSEIEAKLPEMKAEAERLKQEDDDAWSSGDFNKISQSKGFGAFKANSNYESANKAVQSYKNTLRNWKDGSKITYQTGAWAGTPFERVTLDNGAKGYKVERNENGQKVTYYFKVEFDTKTGFAGGVGELYKKE